MHVNIILQTFFFCLISNTCSFLNFKDRPHIWRNFSLSYTRSYLDIDDCILLIEHPVYLFVYDFDKYQKKRRMNKLYRKKKSTYSNTLFTGRQFDSVNRNFSLHLSPLSLCFNFSSSTFYFVEDISGYVRTLGTYY